MNLNNLNKSQLAAIIKIARISDGKFRNEDEMREFIADTWQKNSGTISDRIEKAYSRFNKEEKPMYNLSLIHI